jgi:hypothetical protein
MWIFLFHEMIPCLSQDFRYEGPEDDNSFFAIGWSNDGRRLAYGKYAKYIADGIGEPVCDIEVVVMDLVSDAILWQTEKSWTGPEGNMPESAKQAWIILDQTANAYAEICHQGIQVNSSAVVYNQRTETPQESMFVRNDRMSVGMAESGRYNIEIREGQPEDFRKEYDVYVVSDKLGEKRIAGGEAYDNSVIWIIGYMLNPDKSRMAVIIHVGGGPEFSRSEDMVTGCHLRAGFKMNGK